MAVRGYSRRGGPIDVDHETFVKTQTISIQKAINQQEVAAKEKHVRNAILGTYQERGAQTFWHVVRRLQLSTHAITCWKFCHVLHKLMRDGHERTIPCSLKYKQQLRDLGGVWGHAVQDFARLITRYTRYLVRRLEFHGKYKEFPGNLSISDEMLEKIGNNDINAYFELCVDILDLLEAIMHLQETVFTTLDFSRSNSMTGPGQCRLAPCIPIILDSSQMYDYCVRILFKLHACLPADTLLGHRERFLEAYSKLKKFFYTCSNMQYFKRLIQVPLMPDEPPNFLLTMEKRHQLGPVRMLGEPPATEVDRTPSPEPEPEPEPEPVVTNLIDTNFDAVFGASDSMGDFSFNKEPEGPDPRDVLIQQLRDEIERLKNQIIMMKGEHGREIQQLLDRISELEQELQQAQATAKDSEIKVKNMQSELALAKGISESVSSKQSALAEKAAHSEELFKKMKDKHMGLVREHAELLRKNAETKKQSDSLQQSSEMMQSKRAQLEQETENLQKSLADREREVELRNQENQERQHALFVSAVEATESMICDAVAAMDDPVNSQSTCSAESLMKTVESALNSTDNLESGASEFLDSKNQSHVIQALSSFGHNVSQTLLNGMATCHLVSDEQGENLNKSCRSSADEALGYLAKLKNYRMYDKGDGANIQPVKNELHKILSTAKELLPKMLDLQRGDLQDMVEQEMASTSQAIDDAAQRIEQMLREARERDTGVNLEVNERILDSCTELMEAIRVLIMSSKDLQREIVDQGRGAASVKEFYMKNSRWTEGLISAAKAVGLGATLLTDSADQVVTGDGKFEEIIVCSHEIAASTAQLVAASRVKADKRSEKLPKLQKASKNVNGATARVVASTNSARQQIDESSDKTMNELSQMTLTQIKRREMDCQVRILELEQSLQQERIKIGKYRKQHYILATAEEEDQEEEKSEVSNHNGNTNNNNSAKKLNAEASNKQKPKPPLPQKPAALQSP